MVILSINNVKMGWIKKKHRHTLAHCGPINWKKRLFQYLISISLFQTLFLFLRGHQQQRTGEEELGIEGPEDVRGKGTLWERKDRQLILLPLN